MVRLALRTCGVDYLTVVPSQLKKFGTGSGLSKKEVIIKEVLKRFGVDTNDNNQADALVLVHLGAALCGFWQTTLKAQDEVLKELLKGHKIRFCH